MSRFDTIDSTVPNTQTQLKDQVNAGQIWQDNHGVRPSRFVHVLNNGNYGVACQGLKSGIKTIVRHSQFNRGRTGFSYVADLADLSGGHLMTQLTILKHCLSAPLMTS